MEFKTRPIDLETVDKWRRDFAAKAAQRRALAGEGNNRKARRAARARDRKGG